MLFLPHQYVYLGTQLNFSYPGGYLSTLCQYFTLQLMLTLLGLLKFSCVILAPLLRLISVNHRSPRGGPVKRRSCFDRHRHFPENTFKANLFSRQCPARKLSSSRSTYTAFNHWTSSWPKSEQKYMQGTLPPLKL